MVFTTSKKPDAFMNTAYLNHCCHVLEERMEYPTDQLVVLLVRIQQLSQSISMTLASRNTRESLPLSLIIQSFEHEIHQLRNTIPENLCTNVGLKSQMHIAEILLYETGLHDGLSAGLAATDRLKLLWKCLSATKSMLEARFQQKFDGWPRWISLTSFDYTYAMLVCLKLSLLRLPGWDLRVVRKELSFDEYLMIQIVDLQHFTAHRAKPHSAENGGVLTEGTTGPPPDFQDPFVRLHTRLAQLRLCILTELSTSLPPETQQAKDTNAPPQNANLVDGAAAALGSSMAAVLGETLSSDPMQGLNDAIWQDFYKSNEWETNFSELFGWGSDDAAAPIYTNWTGDVPSY